MFKRPEIRTEDLLTPEKQELASPHLAPHKKRKKFLPILLIIIALIAAGAAGGYFYIKDNATTLSYRFMDYSKYIELPDYKHMKYEINTKKDKEYQSLEALGCIYAKTKFKKYPEKMVEREKDIIKDEFRTEGKRFNLSYHDTIKAYMSKEGMSRKQFNEFVEANAKQNVKMKLVTYAVAKKEGITITKADYEKHKMYRLKNDHLTREKFKKLYKIDFDQYADMHDYKSTCLLAKVGRRILKIAKK